MFGSPPLIVTPAQNAGDLFGEILIPCLILIGLIITAWIAITIVRKRATADDEDYGTPFTLDALRRMHAEGKLTDEEFEQTKARMIGQATGQKPPPRSTTQTQRITVDEPDDEYELGPNLLDQSPDNGPGSSGTDDSSEDKDDRKQ